MTEGLLLFFLGIVTTLFLQWLWRRRALTGFLCHGMLGLLTGVAAVCLSPVLGLPFSLNLFTGGVCLYLGPAGAVGLLALAWLWQ